MKMNLKIPKFKLPYWLGMIGGFYFDFLSKLTNKKLPISSVRVKKFCATTQFDATLVQHSFVAPFSLKEGLDKTLEHEFINPKKDDILFYSEWFYNLLESMFLCKDLFLTSNFFNYIFNNSPNN